MILIVIPPADLPDTGTLPLFGYHLGKVVPQIFDDGDIRRGFPDRVL